jgi:hypothetical protein
MKHLLMLLSFLATGQLLLAGTNTIYFLATEIGQQNYDSFALPLDRPEDIALARQIVANPSSVAAKAPAVRVAPGGDGINRNYVVAGAPAWSWRVVEFYGFVQGAIQSTAPTSLEADVKRNIELYGDRYAFLFHTVTAELGPVLTLVTQDKEEEVLFAWNSLLQPIYLYTLEETASLKPPLWQPVAGGVWPAATNRFVLPKQQAQNRFFRVKASLPKLPY